MGGAVLILGRGRVDRSFFPSDQESAGDCPAHGTHDCRIAQEAPDDGAHCASAGNIERHRQPGSGAPGLSRLSALDPAVPVVRYEHAAPGDLLHLDIKTLGRIEAVGHRITGNPRDHTRGAGFESLFVAIDDHSRIGFTRRHANEGKACAIAFLKTLFAPSPASVSPSAVS